MRGAGHRAWVRIAADDGSPYRAYLDPRGFKRGQKISLIAIARASDGSVSTSPVLTVRPRR
jgi:hypothetical protein